MWTQEVSLLRAHSLGMEDAYLIKNVQNSDNCKHLHLICWVTKRILLKHFVFRYHFRLIDDSEGESYSIMSDSWWPYRLWPTRLLCPWNSPGKNTGAGSHSLLQGIFPTQGLNLGLLHGRWILYRLSHQNPPGWKWLFFFNVVTEGFYEKIYLACGQRLEENT